MNGSDVPHDEMPNFLHADRRDVPQFSDAELAALLAGAQPPTELAPGLRPVGDVLAALRAAPAGHELAGEAPALAEFRRTASPSPRRSHRSHRSRRPTHRPLPSRFGARTAAATVAVLSLGGLATAAYAGVLPAPVQRFAHETIGAPSAQSRQPYYPHIPVNSQAPGAPKAHRSTAQGLCIAYVRAWRHGNVAEERTIFRNLARAAGSTGQVGAYCPAVARLDTVPFPLDPRSHPPFARPSPPFARPSGYPRPSPGPYPTARPTGFPAQGRTAPPQPRATGRPYHHRHGRPAAHPTPHVTGRSPAARS
jgi:hypothetical protein